MACYRSHLSGRRERSHKKRDILELQSILDPIRTRFKLLVAAAAIFFALTNNSHAQSPQAVYYVSPSGSDANDGTVSLPFATLDHARRVVRAMNANMSGDIVIYLRGGTYVLTNTVTFGPSDSGNNGHKIIYKAYESEQPIISGGKTITSWTLHDANKNIWQAKVSDWDNFRQIYVNGVKATRAHSSGPLAGWKTNSTGYSTTDTNLQNFADITNMEIVASPYEWMQERFPIAGITGTNITVTAVKPWAGYGHPTRLENAYEFMNTPGFWHLNRKAHTLYYIPRDGEDMTAAIVEAPVVEEMIAISGNATNPVSNLSFAGLTFRLSNWLQPGTSLGLLSPQANQGEMTNNKIQWVMKSAIDCIGARNVEVTGCTFRQLGGNGINLRKACRDDTVDACAFHDLAAGAIQAGGLDERLPAGSGDIVSGILVTNCSVHDVSTDYQEGCGIFFGYTANCTISHNEIFNLPYTAISLGWGWGRKVAYTTGNRILNNRIHDHMRLLRDGGGIYCNGAQRDGLISGNYIYNQGSVYAELYLDDGSSCWTVASNVCKVASAEEWYLYKGESNHADGNFTDKYYNRARDPGPEGSRNLGKEGCWVRNTKLIGDGNWPQAALDIMAQSGTTRALPQ
jgi:hypothetical protein